MNTTGANIFGNTNNSTTPSGGLFANNSGAGLFANNNSQIQPQGQTQAQTQAPGNIFGSNNTTTSTNAGGLFGNNTSTNTFGATSNASSGGLFNNQPKEPAKPATTSTLGTGGIFGSTPNTGSTAPVQGGLFGGQTTATTGSTAPVQGGLFGGQTTATTGFGQTTNTPQLSATNPPASPIGGLPATTPSFGNSNTQPSTNATTTNTNPLANPITPTTTTPLTASFGAPGTTAFGTTQPTEPAKPVSSQGLSFGLDKKSDTTTTPSFGGGGMFTQNSTANTIPPVTNPTTTVTSATTSTSGTLFTNKTDGLASSNPINASNPPGQQPQNQNQSQSQPQNSAQDLQQKTALDFEKSSKSAKEYIDEWKKTLIECYREINQQCENIKSYSKDRKENYNVIKNFKQLEPVVTQNKKATDSMLDNIERKQYYIMDILNKLKEEILGDTNSKYVREHTLAVQMRDTRDIRKEVKAEEERYGGEQEEDASNSQLKNIFFNLDSVENEIRRLSHVLDHYFAKSN